MHRKTMFDPDKLFRYGKQVYESVRRNLAINREILHSLYRNDMAGVTVAEIQHILRAIRNTKVDSVLSIYLEMYGNSQFVYVEWLPGGQENRYRYYSIQECAGSLCSKLMKNLDIREQWLKRHGE